MHKTNLPTETTGHIEEFIIVVIGIILQKGFDGDL